MTEGSIRYFYAAALALVLASPADARDAHAELVDEHVRQIAEKPELRAAASSEGVQVLTVRFTVGTDGRIGKVQATSGSASVNLRKMVERHFRNLPRTQPPPGDRPRRFQVRLVVR